MQQTEADWGGSTEESLNAKLTMKIQMVDKEDCKPDQQGASLSRELDFRPLSVEPHLRRGRGSHPSTGAAAVHSGFCLKSKQKHYSDRQHY